MQLRFPQNELNDYATRYPVELDVQVERLGIKARERGYLTYNNFIDICKWKTPRSGPLCRSNNIELIEEATQVALSCANEELRMCVLTGLRGVQFPTASAILHFCHKAHYPILDFRALWSLGFNQTVKYSFKLWSDYTDATRELALNTGLSMREVDRGLWQYSKEHQT